MSTIAVVVVCLVAAWVGFSGFSVLTRKAFVVDNLRDYGVPTSWWPWLGSVKLVGAAGIAVGIGVPWIGIAAAAGVCLYFVGAVITVVHARAYTHIPFPLLYLLPALVAGWLIATG